MGNSSAKHTYYAVKENPMSDYPHPAAPCPFAWREAELDSDLYELLFFAVPIPIGYDDNCNDRSPVSPFRHCGGEFVSGHVYYEGVFHGLASTSAPSDSYLRARSHSVHSKPAAPLPLRAFLECFRRANAHWLFNLLPKQTPEQPKARTSPSSLHDDKAEQPKAKTSPSTLQDDKAEQPKVRTSPFCPRDVKADVAPQSDVASPKDDVRPKPQKDRIDDKCFKKTQEREKTRATSDTTWLHDLCVEGKAFADVTVRVHFGDEVPDTDLRWHVNTPLAALQLSFLLEGTRYLHMERHKTSTPNSDDPPHERIEQDIGYLYISSPWVYEHGVEYPISDDDDRIVMIHCQFLMSPDDYARATAPQAQEGWGELMHLVAKRIAGASMKVPTYNQVLRMMSLLGTESM
eukprot:GEMP01029574.1.p1 GENE.GEMP01029574.1~~GEMP01029574.1.p1  ORF type:complete len:403 (+),score=98.40 GEMP01029574.1:239-1447(+)